jgi:hypothetical protein
MIKGQNLIPFNAKALTIRKRPKNVQFSNHIKILNYSNRASLKEDVWTKSERCFNRRQKKSGKVTKSNVIFQNLKIINK